MPMSVLDDELTKLEQLPNGERVARRMIQLWDLRLDPERDYLALSIERVLDVIITHEEKLLGRSQLEMLQSGSVLRPFFQAMRGSTEEEWERAKEKLGVVPIQKTETERLLADSSGLVKNTDFEKWVLGEKEIVAKGKEKTNI
jgi:hypothetical protein